MCWSSPHPLGIPGLSGMLLGLSIATLSTVTHYGLHFTLISNISLESNSYRVIHHAAFYFGICLSMTLILAALLSSAATVRESQCLTAMVRIGRAWLGGAFCNLGLVPLKCGAGVFRTYRSLLSSQVEDSVMDVYDLVYEEVRRNASSFRRHDRLGLTPVLCLMDAAVPFSLRNRAPQPAVRSAPPFLLFLSQWNIHLRCHRSGRERGRIPHCPTEVFGLGYFCLSLSLRPRSTGGYVASCSAGDC
uniref:Uncharacterized protein n=1 Tax=Buteo japonicus TaxID=224669 RepID=A0A8B9ZD77_9AVES